MSNNKSLVLLSLATLAAATSAGNFWNLDIDTHIVNGKPAARGQFPFYALLQIVLSDGRRGVCGGTLLNSQWILTAGHCVSITGVERYEVHLGALNVTDVTEEGRVIVSTKQSFLHPKYSIYGIQNDVGLLKLEEPVQFGNFVQPLNLTQVAREPGTHVTAIGFGKLRSADRTVAPTLQYADLVLITREQCARTFPFLSRREDVICTTGEDKKSPCNGDSGGPLVVLENGVPSLVGSTSFGHIFGCDRGYPAGFANTFLFTSWIQNTIANH